MSSDRPDVSVVIPTRDRHEILRRTLEGALAQEGVDLEVIVVDDGSRDGTAERLAGLDEPRLRIVRNETSRGVGAARNIGIREARGEWLAFLDDDDLWSPQKLKTQIDTARAGGAAVAYAAVAVVDEELDLIEILRGPQPAKVRDDLITGCVIPAGCSNVVATAEIVRAVDGFDERLHQFADWDMWLRLTARGDVAVAEAPLVAYVQHSGSMMLANDLRDLIEEFNYIAAKHSALSRERGIDFDRAGLERWMAWGESRSGRRLAAARRYLRAAFTYGRARNAAMARWSLRHSVGALMGQRLTDSGRPVADDRAAEPAWLDRYR